MLLPPPPPLLLLLLPPPPPPLLLLLPTQQGIQMQWLQLGAGLARTSSHSLGEADEHTAPAAAAAGETTRASARHAA